MRVLLGLFALFFSLIISADRVPDGCKSAWTAHLNSSDSPRGIGVNIHFTDAQPGEMKMIADAGFRWVRMDFKWDLTEPERGRYDFSPYDRLMKELDSHGIRALFILDYGNPHYTVDKAVRTEEARQAFARWAVAAAKHFQGRGIIWEMFNEPNVPMFWPPKPNADEYIALALIVGRSFRAAVPNEKLIGPATSGLDFDFIEACFKAGLLEYWSAVSVHPYRQGNPEIAAAEYCLLREMIEQYRPRSRTASIPIISGEWGYSAVWRGMTEEKQARVLARELLTNVANGIPLSIWYDWQDDGADASEPEHHFGLVRHAYRAGRTPVYEPKPAYHAAKAFNDFFSGYVFEKRLTIGSDEDFVLVFSNGRDRRIAAWTTSSRVQRIEVPLGNGTFVMRKHTGENVRTVIATNSSATVEISSAPIYLIQQ